MIALRHKIQSAIDHILVSIRWLALIVPMAVVVGSAVAFFLWSLEEVTRLRFEHSWLIYFLPLAGTGVGLLYHYYGRSAEGGNGGGRE
jgi:hypothetical protein